MLEPVQARILPHPRRLNPASYSVSFRPPPEAHSGARCASRRPVSCASFRPGLGVVNTLRRHSEAFPRRNGAPCGRLARARTSWPRVRPPKRRLEPLQIRLSSATFHRVAQPSCTNRADIPADRPARPFCTTVLAWFRRHSRARSAHTMTRAAAQRRKVVTAG